MFWLDDRVPDADVSGGAGEDTIYLSGMAAADTIVEALAKDDTSKPALAGYRKRLEDRGGVDDAGARDVDRHACGRRNGHADEFPDPLRTATAGLRLRR